MFKLPMPKKNLFSVGTNFDPELIKQIKDCNVYEVYGKMTADAVGGGRPSFLLGNITPQTLRRAVQQAHQNKIEFNYLLNTTCMGNAEITSRGKKELANLLDLLTRCKVDTVTVAIPYLAIFIRKNYPVLKIDVSTFAGVNNLKKLEQWQALGVNTITLDISANRDFRFLKQAAKTSKGSIKLMVNQCCRPDCMHFNHHANIISHQSTTRDKQFPLEYCSFNCKYDRIKDPGILLKSPWIRPEDLQYYNKLGLNKFKIVQRQDPTEKICRTVRAYFNGEYQGNLLDIMNFVLNLKKIEPALLNNKLLKYIKYFFKPATFSLKKLYTISKLVNDEFGLVINNQKLNGFIDFFIKNNCAVKACDQCGYCPKWAKKVVRFDPQKRTKVLEDYRQILELLC